MNLKFDEATIIQSETDVKLKEQQKILLNKKQEEIDVLKSKQKEESSSTSLYDIDQFIFKVEDFLCANALLFERIKGKEINVECHIPTFKKGGISYDIFRFNNQDERYS